MEVIIVDDNSEWHTGPSEGFVAHLWPDRIKLHARPGKMVQHIAMVLQMHRWICVLMDADPHITLKLYLSLSVSRRNWLWHRHRYEICSWWRHSRGGPQPQVDIPRCQLLANALLAHKTSDLTGSIRLYKKDILEKALKSVKSRGCVF